MNKLSPVLDFGSCPRLTSSFFTPQIMMRLRAVIRAMRIVIRVGADLSPTYGFLRGGSNLRRLTNTAGTSNLTVPAFPATC